MTKIRCVRRFALVTLIGVLAGSVATTLAAAETAQIIKRGGKYYYETDRFFESCSVGTLTVRTTWGNDSAAWTRVDRGHVALLQPAQAPNGTFAWHCGNPLVNGTDYSECNEAPADYVRVRWRTNGNDIDMRCYNICGDGSSAANCPH
jgi:hypothetical protein